MSQAQTALCAYQDGGLREVRTSLRAIFGCQKNYIWVSRILFYAKYLHFGIFRAFSAIFTLRVEDPFKMQMCSVIKFITFRNTFPSKIPNLRLLCTFGLTILLKFLFLD